MLACGCSDMRMMVECDRFMDHVRHRINAAIVAEIEAEDAHDDERLLNGDPAARRPVVRGVIRA